MATIVAHCPYCRKGGVRAPERLIGAVATCPKCGSQFTIVPKDEFAAPTDETQPNAVAMDVTEPSPVLPGSVPGSSETADGVDPAFAGSLIALIAFGLGVLATQFPYGRFIGLGLCGVGLLTGLGCLFSDGLARKLAAAAAVLNLIAVLLLALVPTWLGFDSFKDNNASGMPQGPYSLTLGSNEVGGADRIDAGKAIYANADLRIGVRSGGLQPIDLIGPNGAARKTRENVLKLQVRITNAGVERRVPLSDWALGAAGDTVKLTDPKGNVVKLKAFEPNWMPAGVERTEGVFPGKSAEVVLYFEPPIGAGSKTTRVEYLRLELPGAAVGLTEPIRFQIPGPF